MMIGVTGAIGSGKSVVSRMLASALNCPFVSLDLLCRELMEPKGDGAQFLKIRYGSLYFHADGSLDRARLREAIFQDPMFRKELDGILHPLAIKKMRQECESLHAETIVVEVPLLFEAGWQKEFERVVVVYAEEQVCLQRIIMRDRVDPQNALRALEAQIPMVEKVWRADHVVDNNGSLLAVLLQVKHLAGYLQRVENKNGIKKNVDRSPGRQ
ncbi:MAG: dephospho-CoA kinase [Desulfobulbaceae bacterium]|nr:dephospho-CoA kinase [Desulfobulbaceae bacterium]